MEAGEEDPARDPGKAYPEAFPLLLHFEEMQENIHGGKDAQVPAENLETPYKRPAVGVELGGGCIDLSEEFPLEGSKWETHSYAFKHCLVHKEEGVPLPRSVVQTDRFPRPTGTDGYVSVVSAAESIKVVQLGIPTMSFQVLEGSQAGTLVQELVGGPWVEGFVDGLGGLGGGIRLRICARHGVNK